MNTTPRETSPRTQLVSLALLTSFLFVFLELLKAHRSSFWTPRNPVETLGVLGAFAFYLVLLSLLGNLVRLLLVRALRRALPNRLAPPMALFLAALGIWFVLSKFWTRNVTTDDVLVLGALLGLLFGGLYVTHLKLVSHTKWAALWCTALAAGVLAQDAVVEAFFCHSRRADLCVMLSGGWVVVVATLGGVLLTTVRSPRRRAIFLVAWVCCAYAFPFFAPSFRLPPSDNRESQPNLVFITCDALRADYCSTYGGRVPTPAFDALAREGVLFEQSYSLAPWTLPSMNAMFLSTYPPGLTPDAPRDQWWKELKLYDFNPSEATLAQRLQQQGWTTAAFVGNPLLRSPSGILRGFEYTKDFEPMSREKSGFLARLPFLRDTVGAFLPGLVQVRPKDLSRILNWHALTFLNQNSGRPFFLWVHHIDPHDPYDPPEAFRSLEGPWLTFQPRDAYWGTPRLDEWGNVELTEKERAYTRSLYEGEIRYVDHCIGQIADRINAPDLVGRTYMCVSSDHGEEFWEHGKYGHGQSLYNDLTLVPLIFAGPDLTPRRIMEPVSALDLMPTLAELMNVQAASEWRGTSLAPVLKGAPSHTLNRPCYAQATGSCLWPQTLRMVVDGKLKLIQEAGAEGTELYEVVDDIGEVHDLVASHPADLERLRNTLQEWAETSPKSLSAQQSEDADLQPDPEVERQLRALGYIE